MRLTLREQERPLIYTAANLARERCGCGLPLNLPEATVEVTPVPIGGERVRGAGGARRRGAEESALVVDPAWKGGPPAGRLIGEDAVMPLGWPGALVSALAGDTLSLRRVVER